MKLKRKKGESVLDFNSRMTQVFVKKHPKLKLMWASYKQAQDEYYTQIDKINKDYNEMSQKLEYNDIQSVELWFNMDGACCGIDVNDGYSKGGFDFDKNQMLIQQDVLEEK